MGFTVLQKKESFSQFVPAKLYLSKPSDNKLLSYVTIIGVESKILPVWILPLLCWETGLAPTGFYRGGVSHLKLSGDAKAGRGSRV